MSRTETVASAVEELADGADGESTSGGTIQRLLPHLRRGAESGVFSGVSGAVTLLQGLRSVRRGEVGRGLLRLTVGGLFLAVALAQYRSGGDDHEGDVEARDVVGSGPSVDGTDIDAGGTGDATHEHTGASVVDTGPAAEDVDVDTSSDRDGSDATRTTVDERDVVDTGVDGERLDAVDEDEDEDEHEGAADEDGESLDAVDERDLDDEQSTPRANGSD